MLQRHQHKNPQGLVKPAGLLLQVSSEATSNGAARSPGSQARSGTSGGSANSSSGSNDVQLVSVLLLEHLAAEQLQQLQGRVAAAAASRDRLLSEGAQVQLRLLRR